MKDITKKHQTNGSKTSLVSGQRYIPETENAKKGKKEMGKTKDNPIIRLKYGYEIECETNSVFTLKKETNSKDRKTGEEKKIKKVCGYFSSLEGAIEKFIKLSMRTRNFGFDGDLEEYMKKYEHHTKVATQGLKTQIKALCDAIRTK